MKYIFWNTLIFLKNVRVCMMKCHITMHIKINGIEKIEAARAWKEYTDFIENMKKPFNFAFANLHTTRGKIEKYRAKLKDAHGANRAVMSTR